MDSGGRRTASAGVIGRVPSVWRIACGSTDGVVDAGSGGGLYGRRGHRERRGRTTHRAPAGCPLVAVADAVLRLGVVAEPGRIVVSSGCKRREIRWEPVP